LLLLLKHCDVWLFGLGILTIVGRTPHIWCQKFKNITTYKVSKD